MSESEKPAGPHKWYLSHLPPSAKDKNPTGITLRGTEILVCSQGPRLQYQTLALRFSPTEQEPVLSSPWLPHKFEASHSWAVTRHRSAPGVTGNTRPCLTESVCEVMPGITGILWLSRCLLRHCFQLLCPGADNGVAC